MATQAEREAKSALRRSMDLNGDMRKGGPEMEPQKIVNALVAIVMSLISWWGLTIWSNQKEMQSQITTLTVELARNYAPRAEMQSHFDRIENTLERIDRQTKQGQR